MTTPFNHIFILTGAGISAEAGLGTFRDMGGVWSQYDWHEVASPEGYANNPRLVLDFYDARRAKLLKSTFHAAHTALAKLAQQQAAAGKQLTLVTQNVDDLHERAGAPEVIHMHGQLRKAWCLSCNWKGPWDDPMAVEGDCPNCGPEGQVRPDIVWFGEMPYQMELIEERLMSADLFVSIGTSGSVHPAASFATAAKRIGMLVIELNLEPSINADVFDWADYGPASQIVPKWVAGLIGGQEKTAR
jgi:NAD-dependent deacetylase